jgi:hypothetical protein
MADEKEPVQEVLELEKPNMDEQSAAPKEPVVEPDKKEVEAVVEPEKKEEVAKEKEEVVAEPDKDGFAELPDWAKRELGQKQKQVKDRTLKLTEAEQKIADLEAIIHAGGKKEEAALNVRQAAPVNLTQQQIQAEAQRIVAQQNYERELISTNSAGEKAYGKDWGKSLENLATFGEVPMEIMNKIMSTDAPQKVLYELGKNPAEYQRIMDMPIDRRHTEFVKLSLKAEPAKPRPSAAPEPVETIRGKVTPSAVPLDSDDDDTWYAKYNALQDAKRKRA